MPLHVRVCRIHLRTMWALNSLARVQSLMPFPSTLCHQHLVANTTWETLATLLSEMPENRKAPWLHRSKFKATQTQQKTIQASLVSKKKHRENQHHCSKNIQYLLPYLDLVPERVKPVSQMPSPGIIKKLTTTIIVITLCKQTGHLFLWFHIAWEIRPDLGASRHLSHNTQATYC